MVPLSQDWLLAVAWTSPCNYLGKISEVVSIASFLRAEWVGLAQDHPVTVVPKVRLELLVSSLMLSLLHQTGSLNQVWQLAFLYAHFILLSFHQSQNLAEKRNQLPGLCSSISLEAFSLGYRWSWDPQCGVVVFYARHGWGNLSCFFGCLFNPVRTVSSPLDHGQFYIGAKLTLHNFPRPQNQGLLILPVPWSYREQFSMNGKILSFLPSQMLGFPHSWHVHTKTLVYCVNSFSSSHHCRFLILLIWWPISILKLCFFSLPKRMTVSKKQAEKVTWFCFCNLPVGSRTIQLKKRKRSVHRLVANDSDMKIRLYSRCNGPPRTLILLLWPLLWSYLVDTLDEDMSPKCYTMHALSWVG